MENQTKQWNIDSTHSHIAFVTRHMIVSKVRGEFTDYSGSVELDPSDLTQAKIQFSAKVDSLTTGNPQRDGHLKSDDFFNAEAFPELTFHSTSIEKVADKHFKLHGDLTIRDITKPITLDVEEGGLIKDPYGMHRAGFHLGGKINRSDFNLKWNALLESGGAVVADAVVLDLDVEIVTPAA